MSTLVNAKKHLLPIFSALLFASYPIIFLWSKNWEDVFIQEITINLSVVSITTALLYFCYVAFTKNNLKASIACCITNFMFFSFGYIFNHNSPTFIWLKNTLKVWNYNTLIVAWGLLFLLCLYGLKKSSHKISSVLFKTQNIILITFVTCACSSLFSQLINKKDLLKQEEIILKNQLVSKKLPNIYYIILDEYGRQDTLEHLYKYDNSPFINSLKENNFFVAEKSCSNYSMTALSIPSSLSMNFLTIPKEDKYKSLHSPWCYSPSKTLENSPVIKMLKEYGYLFINIASGHGFTFNIKTADHEMVSCYFSSFTDFLLDQSLFGPFSRKFPTFKIAGTDAKRILSQLSCLSKTPSMESPHFVFCHILCPHFPFVFDENEEEISHYEQIFNPNSDYLLPYCHQISAINKKIMITVKDLLMQDPNSIIILQGDHGPCYGKDFQYYALEKGSFHTKLLAERMGILNAYHFPKENPPMIPNDITPVNSFRIILNHYLGTTLPLLPNTCYWSTLQHPFDFTKYPVEEINHIEIKNLE